MAYVTPTEAVARMVETAAFKAQLPFRLLLVRGFLAGALLGYATSLSFIPQLQGMPSLIGALLFPVGFVLLVLLGLELVTGNFALLPMGLLARRVRPRDLLRNWLWVYLGNLLGGLFYAVMYTQLVHDPKVTELLASIAQRKVFSYQELGLTGQLMAIGKGLLCNWMVTLGTAMAYFSSTTTGKVITMWLPIMTFFALGYEHSVVNMFVLPAALLESGTLTVSDWWVWNQVPVTIGNIIGAVALTSFPLMTYSSHVPQA